VRTAALYVMAIGIFGAACVSAPLTGALGEGSAPSPSITAVDSAFPPKHAWVQISQAGYAALLLVAPGHSATLLYPSDSITNNQLSAGAHQLTFQLPDVLAQTDSVRLAPRARDTSGVSARPRTMRTRTMAPLPPTTPTYLLLVTSPQPLDYKRILEKTAGVSIPNIELEALNAVGKAIKSTIPSEPREWAGYYRLVELRRTR